MQAGGIANKREYTGSRRTAKTESPAQGRKMRLIVKLLMASCLVILLSAIFPVVSQAQHYVYANNDEDSNGDNNLVTAFRVSATGQMTIINAYPTGGLGTGGYNAVTTITTARAGSNHCLFVSNGGSNNVSAFTIKTTDGTLTSVTGSPFASGGAGDNYDIGLAVGNNKLLFAGNTVSSNISVFAINPDCSLTLGQTYGTAGSPDGMKVTPDGRFLIEANLGSPDSWRIDYSNGTLREIGPFSSQGTIAGVDISCDGKVAYFGDAGTGTEVEVYHIGAGGRLTEINNYTNTNGQNSNNVLLSADGKKLYVSETASNQVETLSGGSSGALTFDSVVTLKVGQFSSVLGMASQRNGHDIFVAETGPAAVGVLQATGTTLTEVPNSPFSLNDNFAFIIGVTAFPPEVCP
jgi:6-phosphogluconolactonase (cycloisomerase 2 family)